MNKKPDEKNQGRLRNGSAIERVKQELSSSDDARYAVLSQLRDWENIYCPLYHRDIALLFPILPEELRNAVVGGRNIDWFLDVLRDDGYTKKYKPKGEKRGAEKLTPEGLDFIADYEAKKDQSYKEEIMK